jgi:hypothetical protein
LLFDFSLVRVLPPQKGRERWVHLKEPSRIGQVKPDIQVGLIELHCHRRHGLPLVSVAIASFATVRFARAK